MKERSILYAGVGVYPRIQQTLAKAFVLKRKEWRMDSER